MKYTFLFCTERSGSNLITSIANGHSQFCGPPPSHLFRLFGLNWHKYAPLNREQNWQRLLDDFHAAQETMLGTWNTAFSRTELEAGTTKGSIGSLFDFMYGRESQHDGAGQLFVKENYAYRIVPFLLEHWPDAKFVHMVRDPRDVVASWINTDSVKGGTVQAVETWLKDQECTLEVIEKELKNSPVLFLRYEDLVSNPKKTLKQLCDYLGVTYEPEMLEFQKDERTIKNAGKINAWANLSRPLMTGNIHKFRNSLSDVDLKYVELKCQRLMRQFGYDAESHLEATDIDAMKPHLSTGTPDSTIDSRENEVRTRRREVIERVVMQGAP